MPIGIYKHKSQQGFQKGHIINVGRKFPDRIHPSGLKYNISEKTKMVYRENAKKNFVLTQKRTGKYIECPACEKITYKKLCYIKDSKHNVFCSHKCYSKWLKGKPSWNKGHRGYLAGDKHYNWKGGITPINKKIRSSADWKLWRKYVFEKDNYTCQICGNNKTVLHPHHLLPLSKFKQLCFETWNGLTVCVACHIFLHRKKGGK